MAGLDDSIGQFISRIDITTIMAALRKGLVKYEVDGYTCYFLHAARQSVFLATAATTHHVYLLSPNGVEKAVVTRGSQFRNVWEVSVSELVRRIANSRDASDELLVRARQAITLHLNTGLISPSTIVQSFTALQRAPGANQKRQRLLEELQQYSEDAPESPRLITVCVDLVVAYASAFTRRTS